MIRVLLFYVCMLKLLEMIWWYTASFDKICILHHDGVMSHMPPLSGRWVLSCASEELVQRGRAWQKQLRGDLTMFFLGDLRAGMLKGNINICGEVYFSIKFCLLLTLKNICKWLLLFYNVKFMVPCSTSFNFM